MNCFVVKLAPRADAANAEATTNVLRNEAIMSAIGLGTEKMLCRHLMNQALLHRLVIRTIIVYECERVLKLLYTHPVVPMMMVMIIPVLITHVSA